MIRQVSPPTLLAEGTKLRGSVTFYSTTNIFGMIEGDVDCQCNEVLQIGKSGWIYGNVISRGPIVIEGRVDGDVKSTSAIRLLASADVRGRLEAPGIEVRSGAMFNGEFFSGKKDRQQNTHVTTHEALAA